MYEVVYCEISHAAICGDNHASHTCITSIKEVHGPYESGQEAWAEYYRWMSELYPYHTDEELDYLARHGDDPLFVCQLIDLDELICKPAKLS